MTVFFVHQSMLPDLLDYLPGAVVHECQLIDGEIGLVDGYIHIVPMEKIVPFDVSPARIRFSEPRARGAQWKSERGLAGRRWGK